MTSDRSIDDALFYLANPGIDPLLKAGAPGGRGWQSVPKGHGGGFRRMKPSGGYEYWYPSQAESAQHAQMKDEAAGGGKAPAAQAPGGGGQAPTTAAKQSPAPDAAQSGRESPAWKQMAQDQYEHTTARAGQMRERARAATEKDAADKKLRETPLTVRLSAYLSGLGASFKDQARQSLTDLKDPKHLAERLWGGLKHTVQEYPHAVDGVKALATGHRPTRSQAMAMVSVTTTVGSLALTGASGGAGAVPSAAAAKFATHVAVAALSHYAAVVHTGHAASEFAEKLLEYGEHLLKADQPVPPQGGDDTAGAADPAAMRALVEALLESMKAVLTQVAGGQAPAAEPDGDDAKGAAPVADDGDEDNVQKAKYLSRKRVMRGGKLAWDYTYPADPAKARQGAAAADAVFGESYPGNFRSGGSNDPSARVLKTPDGGMYRIAQSGFGDEWSGYHHPSPASSTPGANLGEGKRSAIFAQMKEHYAAQPVTSPQAPAAASAGSARADAHTARAAKLTDASAWATNPQVGFQASVSGEHYTVASVGRLTSIMADGRPGSSEKGRWKLWTGVGMRNQVAVPGPNADGEYSSKTDAFAAASKHALAAAAKLPAYTPGAAVAVDAAKWSGSSVKVPGLGTVSLNRDDVNTTVTLTTKSGERKTLAYVDNRRSMTPDQMRFLVAERVQSLTA